MKKLVMSALLLGALSQAAGCIFVSSDDTVDDTGAIDVAWSLADGGCELADTATINALLSGDSTPYRDIYDCVDGGGITQDLPLGEYEVWVDFTNGSGGDLVAQSTSDLVLLDSPGDLVVLDPFLVNMSNGYFDVGWTFSGGESCADYTGEDGISVLATEVGNPSNSFDDIFDCEDGYGVTGEYSIGDYTIATSIIDGQGAVIGEAPDVTESIFHGNEFVVIDVVISPI